MPPGPHWSGSSWSCWSATGASGLFRTAAEWVASWLPWPLAPAAAVALFSAGLAVTVHAIELPFAWYQGYWLERRYGLSTQILPHWLADHVKAAVASCARDGGRAVGGLPLDAVGPRAAGGRYRPRCSWWRWSDWPAWPRWCCCRSSTASVRCDRPELSERLLRLAARAGAPVIGAYEWALSGHTRKANAALAGIGRSRRILISDTMLDAYSDDEIEVVLAHELSHHVHHDLWRGMAMQAATIVAGFYVAAGVARAAPCRGSGCAGPPTSPAPRCCCWSAGIFSFAMLPIGNAMSRAQERRADRFALRLTGNPAAFVTAMRRLSQQNLAEERPSRLARWLFYSHPPMRERIEAAQAWTDVAAPLHAHAILPAKK